MAFQYGAFQQSGFQEGPNWGAPSNCVLSDVLLQGADLSFAQFETRFSSDVPPTFGAFAPFMPGDHEYDSAMVKAAITSDGVQVLRITALDMQIDLPDIIRQGTTVVTGTGQADVTFATPFNIAPEIIVSMKSGTQFIKPRVENITTTGFRVVLRNASNTPVAGTVTWVAHGY